MIQFEENVQNVHQIDKKRMLKMHVKINYLYCLYELITYIIKIKIITQKKNGLI